MRTREFSQQPVGVQLLLDLLEQWKLASAAGALPLREVPRNLAHDRITDSAAASYWLAIAGPSQSVIGLASPVSQLIRCMMRQ